MTSRSTWTLWFQVALRDAFYAAFSLVSFAPFAGLTDLNSHPGNGLAIESEVAVAVLGQAQPCK